MPVRISLFFLVMAVIVGLLQKHFPESLVGSITPAVAFLVVLVMAIGFFGMLFSNSGLSSMLRKFFS